MKQHIKGGVFNVFSKQYPRDVETIGDSGSAARFFYSAKVSKRERDAGLEGLPETTLARSGGAQVAEAQGEDYAEGQEIGMNKVHKVRNNHPTLSTSVSSSAVFTSSCVTVPECSTSCLSFHP